MTSWLSKQKKGDLQSLADRAGFKHDNLLKEELISSLDTHLRANSSKFSDDKAFSEFYERSGSPTKKGRPTTAEGEPKPPRRRTLAPKPDPSSPDGTSTAVVPASPGSFQALASRVRLPASPAVSRALNAQTTWAKRQYTQIVKKSGVKKNLPLLRQEFSRVETIQLLTLIFEALGLREKTFPLRWTVIPGNKALYNKQTAIWFPNFALLLSSDFWAPTTLWVLTSLVLPLTFAYFFNLTYTNPRPKTRRVQPLRDFDPLTFSIAKGVLAYLVYSPAATFTFWGAFSADTVGAVHDGIWGHYVTLLIGSGIGILTALYDHLSFKS